MDWILTGLLVAILIALLSLGVHMRKMIWLLERALSDEADRR